MHKVNSLVLCEEDYASTEEWQQEIGKAIMMLVKAQYIIVAQLEEVGIFRIDYETEHQDWGAPYPYWLSPDEAYSVIRDENRE